jgi:hypothetical protein
MNIPLGFEVGTGTPVKVPVNHTVVLGQTQLSGKTTTLEAMVTRSGLRAVGFITKPGESSFRLLTRIPAFFTESTADEYWRHVTSMLEYRSETKLGWRERGVLIKLCQSYHKDSSRIGFDTKSGKSKRERVTYDWDAPKTLEQLLANIERYMPYAKSAEEMICIQLREYLRPVIREIGKTEFSDKLRLEPGINVMDITDLSDGLKSLVIRSVIETVHRKLRKTVVIVPEAWKFIPEGRSTPVKLALEHLIREGAGVGNFVWMDSQDLRGVDKMLLRSVIVWLFGVQRQKNEVASTLASIPDHPKPTASEIMQLGKGEFYVCYGTTLVHTYVQPAGMNEEHAKAIARGDERPESWNAIKETLEEEDGNNAGIVARDESETKPDRIGGDRSEDSTGLRESPNHFAPNVRSAAEGFDRVSETEMENAETIETDSAETSSVSLRLAGESDYEEIMWKEKYEALEAEHKTLIEAHDALAARVHELQKALQGNGGLSVNVVDLPSGKPMDYETIYQWIRGRVREDRDLLLLVTKPELSVRIERPVVTADTSTLFGKICSLLTIGFFKEPKPVALVAAEAIRRGFCHPKTPHPRIADPLEKLASMGFLTREADGYLAVRGMKITENKARE